MAEADLYHLLRALTWFEDAEADATLPRGLTVPHWQQIRTWYEATVAGELRKRTR